MSTRKFISLKNEMKKYLRFVEPKCRSNHYRVLSLVVIGWTQSTCVKRQVCISSRLKIACKLPWMNDCVRYTSHLSAHAGDCICVYTWVGVHVLHYATCQGSTYIHFDLLTIYMQVGLSWNMMVILLTSCIRRPTIITYNVIHVLC